MAQAPFTIEIKSSWEAVETDGSLCFGCHCDCFLGQYQLVLRANGEVIEQGETMLCSSCYDAVRADQ